MRRFALLFALVSLLTALFAAPASAAPYCGITWGSLPEEGGLGGGGPIVGARAGRHACFDRFVVDTLGSEPQYWARYTAGTGGGGGVLQVSVMAPTYDDNFNPTVPWRVGQGVVDLRGFQTLRGAVYQGSFEATTDFELHTRARLPFRIFTLPGPGTGSRLVIDVAHHW